MYGINSATINAGTFITITVNGIQNSQYAAATDSFGIMTLTSDGYSIDQKDTGLTVTNNCDYPCKTCSGSTSTCTSCDLASTYKLFYNNQCLKSCLTGYYGANYQCLPCDSNCRDCSGGANQCTYCYPASFLLGNTCL